MAQKVSTFNDLTIGDKVNVKLTNITAPGKITDIIAGSFGGATIKVLMSRSGKGLAVDDGRVTKAQYA